MATGDGVRVTDPVAVRWPEPGSRRNGTMVSESWFATSNQAPVGSREKFRGVFPRVASYQTGRSSPFTSATSQMAMLSCPRFDP
jgi:hypothetical protein